MVYQALPPQAQLINCQNSRRRFNPSSIWLITRNATEYGSFRENCHFITDIYHFLVLYNRQIDLLYYKFASNAVLRGEGKLKFEVFFPLSCKTWGEKMTPIFFSTGKQTLWLIRFS